MTDARHDPSTLPDAVALPAASLWVDAVQAAIAARAWHPARVVVLVPYAQMMEAGRNAWVARVPAGFPPRFESTRNWAAALAPFAPGALDISGDTARDSLIAARWVARVAGRGLDADLRATLVTRLVDAARQLAPLAAAQAPAQRMAWAEALRDELAPGGQNLRWEGMVASLALTWAGVSAYATDVLWGELAAPGAVADGLLLVPGFQDDPLSLALLARWGAQGVKLEPWAHAAPEAVPAPVRWQAGGDAEDEAQRAAASVIAAVNAGHAPVALMAQDRALTRRIGAMLAGAGLTVRDETGWKLSTTHAAARLVALLRAADRRARTDDVLDWLRHSSFADAVPALEAAARDQGLPQWRALSSHPLTAERVPAPVAELLSGLQAPRALARWLADLRSALHTDGWWPVFEADPAGQRVIDLLRLHPDAAHELEALDADEAPGDGPATARRWSQGAFSAWVREVLESGSFHGSPVWAPQVVVLPMAQLLGRGFGAVVAPGCDEQSLPPSLEPPGAWSAAQRERLGLPGREALAQAAKAAWDNLLAQPRVHLLWRTQQQGEAVSAAPWVQALLGTDRATPAPDPREWRSLPVVTAPDPAPVAPDLLPSALSASAYQDLRDCPYRFFALRQLRLRTADEIESEPDKRDLGNWLHAVLKAFHEARQAGTADGLDDRARLDEAAQAEAVARGLAPESGESGAAFLPFMAAWPALRDGYLAWLAGHEAGGPHFERAEVSLTRQVGPWRLIGQLDRIDRQPSPEGPMALVIDYKSEPRKATEDRVKQPLEDTQIAFYAALLNEETVRGAYLSITDSREADARNPATRWVEQPELLLARDHLVEAIAHDLGRIAEGHALPALGEGKVCDFCAARGLCRKDFKA